MTMKSSVIGKKETQAIIKSLRASGYTVDKIANGYSCELNGEIIFKAMQGGNGYLCRFNTSVFNF